MRRHVNGDHTGHENPRGSLPLRARGADGRAGSSAAGPSTVALEWEDRALTDVEQNAAIRQFYGCHFGSADDLQLGERLLQSQNTCVGDVGAGEDQ